MLEQARACIDFNKLQKEFNDREWLATQKCPALHLHLSNAATHRSLNISYFPAQCRGAGHLRVKRLQTHLLPYFPNTLALSHSC